MVDLEELYICVYVCEFPAQARLRLRQDLLQKPVAILEGDPPLQIVCSANRKARSLGVRNGMTKVQLDAFTAVMTLPRSFPEEKAVQNVLLATASSFSPRIERLQRDEDFSFVLDMTGSGRIFGEAQQATQRVLAAMEATGVSVSVAASGNFHAAACAAPFARKLIVIAQGSEAAELGSLPVCALILSPAQAERFDLWGIRTIQQFAELPESDLVARLGSDAKRLRNMASGTSPYLMVPEEAPFILEDYVEFASPEELVDSLLFVLGPVLDGLIALAQTRALSLAAITLTMSLHGGGEHVCTIKPALPSSERTTLLRLLNLHIQAHPPAAGVEAMRVSAEAERRGKMQIGLFSPQLPEPSRLDIVLAQIEAMVGEGLVGHPRLLDTHRADAFTVDRFSPTDKPRPFLKKRVVASLRRVRPMIPLRMIVNDESMPHLFYFDSTCYVVSSTYGPWRQSGDWWTQRIWSREDWDIRASAGNDTLLCVITHDLLRHEWHLEALYD